MDVSTCVHNICHNEAAACYLETENEIRQMIHDNREYLTKRLASFNFNSTLNRLQNVIDMYDVDYCEGRDLNLDLKWLTLYSLKLWLECYQKLASSWVKVVVERKVKLMPDLYLLICL